MAIKPKPMKIKCTNCHGNDIYAPKSDFIVAIPKCKKCGSKMEINGSVGIADWIGKLMK